MSKSYLLIIQFVGSSDRIVMNAGLSNYVMVSEENKHLLLESGKQLMEANIISSYQLFGSEGPVYSNGK